MLCYGNYIVQTGPVYVLSPQSVEIFLALGVIVKEGKIVIECDKCYATAEF